MKNPSIRNEELCNTCGLEEAEVDGMCWTCEIVHGTDMLEDIGRYLATYDESTF